MKITKQQLKQIIKEEIDQLGHPTEGDPGHELVIAANDALHEAYVAVEALATYVDEHGKEAIPAHAAVTIGDVQSKIDSINREASYLK